MDFHVGAAFSFFALAAGSGLATRAGAATASSFFAAAGFFSLTITEESKRDGDGNTGNEFGDFIRKEGEGTYKEQRGGNI